jgi:hypothetical protein
LAVFGKNLPLIKSQWGKSGNQAAMTCRAKVQQRQQDRYKGVEMAW